MLPRSTSINSTSIKNYIFKGGHLDMEKYNPQKSNKQIKRHDKNFILTKATNMNPFKIAIYSEEFLNILADIITNPGTKYHAIDDMVDDIHQPIKMKIDSEVYKELMGIGEKKDIELVCKYVAVQRILTCSNNTKFTGMISKVRDVIRDIPVSTRHVITGDVYRKLFAIIPAAYLSSVCNLVSANKEVERMDKSVVKSMTSIMSELTKLTEVDDNVLSDAYTAIVDLVKRTLIAYRDHNIIDLGNLVKMIGEMFNGEYDSSYFEKLINTINKDISDSFSNFDKLVAEVKESDNTEFTNNKPDPMEYDPIDSNEMDVAMGVEINEEPIDPNNDSVLGPDETQQTDVNTGLDNNIDNSLDSNNMQTGGVVTGLESVMTESLLKKKLKRISRETIGYVKVRGANARDADELTMVISYGYYIAEKCEWYMDIIQREDDRYVVPQTYSELESIKNEMYRTLDSLMKDPVFRKRGSVYSNRGIELF